MSPRIMADGSSAVMQQVIDESMKNFKAFFRWVYVEILRLSEETVAGDLSKVGGTGETRQ